MNPYKRLVAALLGERSDTYSGTVVEATASAVSVVSSHGRVVLPAALGVRVGMRVLVSNGAITTKLKDPNAAPVYFL